METLTPDDIETVQHDSRTGDTSRGYAGGYETVIIAGTRAGQVSNGDAAWGDWSADDETITLDDCDADGEAIVLDLDGARIE